MQNKPHIEHSTYPCTKCGQMKTMDRFMTILSPCSCPTIKKEFERQRQERLDALEEADRQEYLADQRKKNEAGK